MIFIGGCKNYVKSLDIDRENIIENSKISSLDVKTQVSALLSKKNLFQQYQLRRSSASDSVMISVTWLNENWWNSWILFSKFLNDFHLKTMKWQNLCNFMECDINYKISKSGLFCYPDCIADNNSGTSLPF